MFTSSIKSAKILKELNPDVVVGTGGYVSGPVLREAAKLGFKKVLMPKSIKKKNLPDLGIKIIEIGHLQDLVNMFMK